MTLPTKEERIRRKKAMLDAGISVPNTDESWGPWWDKLWKKAITHTKTNDYYGNPSPLNFLHKTWDNITGNTTYEAEPQPITGTLSATDESLGAEVKRTLTKWKREGDPIRDIVLLAMPGGGTKGAITKIGKAVKFVKNHPKETAQIVGRALGTGLKDATIGLGTETTERALFGKSVGDVTSNYLLEHNPILDNGFYSGLAHNLWDMGANVARPEYFAPSLLRSLETPYGYKVGNHYYSRDKSTLSSNFPVFKKISLENLENFLNKPATNDIIANNQRLVRDLLSNPEKYGKTVEDVINFNKSFGPQGRVEYRKTFFKSLRENSGSNTPELTAAEKASLGIDITGKEVDYLGWVRNNGVLAPELPNFLQGANSPREYYNTLREWYNERPVGTVFRTGDLISTDSSLDFISAFSGLMNKKKVHFMPYKGGMVSTNDFGRRIGLEAVEAFNAKVDRMIASNPDIDFGDIPGALPTESGNIIRIPELSFIKVSPSELKGGGKLRKKLIKRKRKWK